MGLARPDLSTVAVGAVAVGLADSRGAQALFDASRAPLPFSDGPGGVTRTMKMLDVVSALGGDVGRLAAEVATDKETADGFKAEADARRSSVEGVNLDEELVKLTSFQQAYSAAARMIRAVDEMYQTVLQAV